MAVEITRNIDPAILTRLNALDSAQARVLADQYNRGAIDEAALSARIQAYNKVTASSTGAAFNASAARFASVSPIRSETPSADAARAMAMTARLDLSNPAVSESRPAVIESITRAIA